MDFSKYASSVYESHGLDDARLAREEERRYSGGGGGGSLVDQWVTHPRAKQCIHSIQMGAKMGAAIGGCFGFLTGCWAAVTTRNVLVLPVSVVGGSISFGFFLGCGMIVRCEDQQRLRCLEDHPEAALYMAAPQRKFARSLESSPAVARCSALVESDKAELRLRGSRARALAAIAKAGEDDEVPEGVE